MQRNAIVLAVLGVMSGAACAQSNVTIYGVMDVFAGVAKADNATGKQSQTVINQGGLQNSRLGFMGEESLGNGLKSIFKLELGTLDITAASNNITSTRQSWVGLKSDALGTAYMGRVQTLGYDFAVKYDPMTTGNLTSPMGAMGRGSSILIAATGANGRQSNALAYISPNLSGLTVRANAASGEQVTGTSGTAGYKNAQSFYSLGADYDKGPLAIGIALAQLKDNGGTLNNANAAGIKDWALAGTYDFNIVKAFALYQESKATAATGTKVKSKLWSTGINIPVTTAGIVKVGFVGFKDDALAQKKATGWGIDYEHSLSKRTTAYVGYQSINNGSNASFSVVNASSVTPGSDKNASVVGLGLRHTF